RIDAIAPMIFIVSSKEEALLVRKRDRSTQRADQFVLVLDRLLGRNGISVRIFPRQRRCAETPGIEDRIADKGRCCAVILLTARLDREIQRACALVLRSR